MDWDFIIQCILAVGLSVTLLALLDSRIKLRAERKKTSIFYGISRNLEGDTWKQKDTIDVQQGTIQAQQGTIEEQNGTIQEQRQEIESLEADLKESKAMAERLMQRSRANSGRYGSNAKARVSNAGTHSRDTCSDSNNSSVDGCNAGNDCSCPDVDCGNACSGYSDSDAGNGYPEVTALAQRLLMLSDELANIYYESSSRPETMGRRIVQVLHTGLTDRDAQTQIDSLIDASYPGFLSDLHSTFPWMNADDRLLISLMCCGITPNAISIILGIDLNRLNKWKTRLAKQMNSPVRLSKFLNEKLLSYCNGPSGKQ